MEKLTEQNRAEVEAYISAEPEYNVFVQGDLENYGFESKTVEIFGTRAADGALCALLLRYFNNYCLCMSGTAPVEELAAFLQARGAQYLSGKEADVAALAARMPGWKLRGTNLARMDRLAGGAALPEGFSLRMLGPQDAQAVIGLEVQIDEFADSFRGVDREEKVEECRENLTRGGHAFGVYDGDRLVALAETTAENSVSAMVVGVATLPGMARERLCRACVHAAAAHSFARRAAVPVPVLRQPRGGAHLSRAGLCGCGTFWYGNARIKRTKTDFQGTRTIGAGRGRRRGGLWPLPRNREVRGFEVYHGSAGLGGAGGGDGAVFAPYAKRAGARGAVPQGGTGGV